MIRAVQISHGQPFKDVAALTSAQRLHGIHHDVPHRRNQRDQHDQHYQLIARHRCLPPSRPRCWTVGRTSPTSPTSRAPLAELLACCASRWTSAVSNDSNVGASEADRAPALISCDLRSGRGTSPNPKRMMPFSIHSSSHSPPAPNLMYLTRAERKRRAFFFLVI
jgi:hypothetical protein